MQVMSLKRGALYESPPGMMMMPGIKEIMEHA
jgi:hypothetical protein